MVKKYCLEALHEKKNIEALHEITDFVHEMLSVCAPLGVIRTLADSFACKKYFFLFCQSIGESNNSMMRIQLMIIACSSLTRVCMYGKIFQICVLRNNSLGILNVQKRDVCIPVSFVKCYIKMLYNNKFKEVISFQYSRIQCKIEFNYSVQFTY